MALPPHLIGKGLLATALHYAAELAPAPAAAPSAPSVRSAWLWDAWPWPWRLLLRLWRGRRMRDGTLIGQCMGGGARAPMPRTRLTECPECEAVTRATTGKLYDVTYTKVSNTY